jgi:hypothetical protein
LATTMGGRKSIMPAVTSRNITPEAFLKRIRSLYGSVRTDIRKALKKANNRPEDLPEELWKEIEEKQRRVLFLLLLGFGLSSLNMWHQWSVDETPLNIPYETAERRFESLAQRNARAISRKINATTKRLLRHRMKSFESGESLTNAVKDVIPDHRVVTTTRTEIQVAIGLGTDAVLQAYTGRMLHGYMQLGPCEHCKVCPIFHRVDIDFVRDFFPRAPTIHPNCCCRQMLVYGTKKDLIESGVMVANPDRRLIVRAMGEQGFKLPSVRK